MRELRSDVAIVARASEEDFEKKLKRAGVDRVIPLQGERDRDGRLALHPHVSVRTILQPGDVIVAMGTPRTLERVERLFTPPRGREAAAPSPAPAGTP